MNHGITMLARIFVIAALVIGALGKFLRLPRADRLSFAREVVLGAVVTVAMFGGIPAIVLAVCGAGAFYRASMSFQTLRAFGLACLAALFVTSVLYLRRSFRRRQSRESATTGGESSYR